MAPKISLPRVSLPTTLTTTSCQTELSIVHEENGKEMIVDETRDYQAELIQMKNEHYERELEAIQDDNAYLMALLQEQAELMQQMKVVKRHFFLSSFYFLLLIGLPCSFFWY